MPPSFRIEPLPGYTPTIGRLVGMLTYARKTTLDAVDGLSMAELDHLQDGALERTVSAAPAMNAHWAWFHVAEDEISHRGQIRWLRARLA